MADDPNAAPPVPPQATDQTSTDSISGMPPERGSRPQPWAVSFALFAAGFVILIVAGKIGSAPLWSLVLKGFGVAFCVVGFLFARRDRNVKL